LTYLRTRLGDADENKDDLKAFLREVGETPLLTAADEVRLAQAIELGVLADAILAGLHLPEPDSPAEASVAELELLSREGHDAMRRFIEANLRLVVALARKYRNQLPLSDAIQEGAVGLIRAVEKFDYAQGFKFSTYATWWIRQAIDRALSDHARIIHLPLHVHEQIAQMVSARRTLEARLGRAASLKEIADELGRDLAQVSELAYLARQYASLDAPVDEAGTTTLGELLPADSEVSVDGWTGPGQDRDRLELMILDLDDRSADIIRRRYGLLDGRPAQLVDVARHWGITTERVRQLERKALAQIRGQVVPTGG
jgi:RNA polymerase sigma factor (sigma-70 family)